jgi:hypothetical protein
VQFHSECHHSARQHSQRGDDHLYGGYIRKLATHARCLCIVASPARDFADFGASDRRRQHSAAGFMFVPLLLIASSSCGGGGSKSAGGRGGGGQQRTKVHRDGYRDPGSLMRSTTVDLLITK